MLLEVHDLFVEYPLPSSGWGRRSAILQAVKGVSLHVADGETLGIVGESGCGKSTLVRATVGLVKPASGSVLIDGRPLDSLDAVERQRVRRNVQMVFQDPHSSLDPRMRIGTIVAEPLMVHEPSIPAAQFDGRVAAALEQVGLSLDYQQRYPHELSGGQCQRVAIARALILQPKLLICDEPVSSLDVSVQAQIVNLLKDLQRRLQLAMIFVSHNMAVVRQVSARVLVMHAGQVMEVGATDDIFARPQHPYTRALLAAVPVPPARATRAS